MSGKNLNFSQGKINGKSANNPQSEKSTEYEDDCKEFIINYIF